jgi:hypothetical protein
MSKYKFEHSFRYYGMKVEVGILYIDGQKSVSAHRAESLEDALGCQEIEFDILSVKEQDALGKWHELSPKEIQELDKEQMADAIWDSFD